MNNPQKLILQKARPALFIKPKKVFTTNHRDNNKSIYILNK